MRPGDILRLAPRPRRAPYGERRLAGCHSVDDLAVAARRRLPRAVIAYLEGGGEDEHTLRENRQAFDRLHLRPRVLRDVSDIDLSTTLLGRRVSTPLVLAPVGAPRFLHHEGELAVARAAAGAGIPYAISTVGSTAIDEVAREADETALWLQLYLWGDRAVSRDLVDCAKAAGYQALLLTADVSVRSKRERELRAGLTLPAPRLSVSTFVDAALHPSWCWHFLTNPLPSFPNVEVSGRGRARWDLADLFDGTVCWDDLAWIKDCWSGPVVVKGVLTAEDARRAADAGADGVVVSNHGGRQLDHVPATIDALPAVVKAVGDRLTVMFDSGIRRGTAVLAALSLGADAVLVGRAYLYGLAAAGDPGVRHAIDIVLDELRRAMALCGARSLAEIEPGLVLRRPDELSRPTAG